VQLLKVKQCQQTSKAPSQNKGPQEYSHSGTIMWGLRLIIQLQIQTNTFWIQASIIPKWNLL